MKEKLISLGIAASAITGCSYSQQEMTIAPPKIQVSQLLQNPNQYENSIVEINGTIKYQGKKGNGCALAVLYQMYSGEEIKNKPFVKTMQLFVSKMGGQSCDLEESKIPAYDGKAIIRAKVEKVSDPGIPGEFPGSVELVIKDIFGVGYNPVM